MRIQMHHCAGERMLMTVSPIPDIFASNVLSAMFCKQTNCFIGFFRWDYIYTYIPYGYVKLL